MAMFPDSGVLPSDAKNSLPDVDTTNQADELWYSTSRCQPRFDPAAANAMLAEDMNLVMKGEVTYDGLRLDNLERSVRYMIQRGLPHSGFMAVGPSDYALTLDPPLTRYSDHLTLIIVPNVDNVAGSRVDVNGKGLRPILRNDGQQLRNGDLKSGIPSLISYWAGNFYVVGLVKSQVATLGGAIDGWIRPDGNDDTGDGTANTPDKAFRTIQGAWAAIGSRYAQTPAFNVNLRLGIPGDYEPALIGNVATTMTITGDKANKAGYRIATRTLPNVASYGYGLTFSDCNRVYVTGLTIEGATSGVLTYAFTSARSTLWIADCTIRAKVANALFTPYVAGGGGVIYATGFHDIYGLGAMRCLMDIGGGSIWAGQAGHTMSLSNIAFTAAALAVYDLSLALWGPAAASESGVTGPEYVVGTNSILETQGKNVPGNTPGTVNTGGQVI